MYNIIGLVSVLAKDAQAEAYESATKVGPSFTKIDLSFLNGLFTGPGLLLLILVFIVLIVVLSYLGKQNKQMMKPKEYTYTPVPDEEIKKILKDETRETLVKKAFDLYYKLEDCYNNQNEKELRNYASNSMYNMYIMKLEDMKVKHQRNVIDQIELIAGDVISLKEEHGFYDLVVVLNVKARDYIINTTSNEIVGTGNNILMNYTYEVTLLKEETIKCPKCDADLDPNSDVCPNCHVQVIKNDKWVVGKIELKDKKQLT